MSGGLRGGSRGSSPRVLGGGVGVFVGMRGGIGRNWEDVGRLLWEDVGGWYREVWEESLGRDGLV